MKIIDREKIKKRFHDYVQSYDLEDPKIALKVAHTYRVGDLSETIGKSLNLCEEDLDIAWTLGMLHDVGRFEQCRIFDSFIDSATVDHAKFGCHLLFGDPKEDALPAGASMIEVADFGKISIRDFVEDDSLDELMHDAIYFHNMYRIPVGIDDRTRMFSNILRDADKIDILRVNVETPLEDVYNVSTEKLKSDQVTEAVIDNFMQKTAVDKHLKRTSVDNVVGHISLVYELVYPISTVIVNEQGYLEKLMNFKSNNEKTNKQFEIIRQFMNDYLKSIKNSI